MRATLDVDGRDAAHEGLRVLARLRVDSAIASSLRAVASRAVLAVGASSP